MIVSFSFLLIAFTNGYHIMIYNILGIYFLNRASLVARMVKNPHECGRPGFDPWDGKIPWRRAWQPTPVFLPGESPRTEKPGGLQSIGLQRVRHDWVTKHIYWINSLITSLKFLFLQLSSFFFGTTIFIYCFSWIALLSFLSFKNTFFIFFLRFYFLGLHLKIPL